MSIEACAGCGLLVAGGTEGCQRLFEELGLRDLISLTDARRHRMAVDAYALQHPDRYCRSGKSLMAHLTGLACAFEYGGSDAVEAAKRETHGYAYLTDSDKCT